MPILRLTFLLPFVAGCSLVFPANQVQCDTDEECAARGFDDSICEAQACVPRPVDPVWGCLGNIEEPVITPGATHTVTFQFIDALTRLPPDDIEVRLCTQLDLSCMSPMVAGIELDAEGHGAVDVPSGFQGFFELTSSTTLPAIVPVGPVVADAESPTVEIVAGFVVTALADTAGVTLDLEKGIVLMLLTGCEPSGRAGVSFSADVEADSFYLYSLNPDTLALESDDSGQGGILNLEPGFVTLTTTRFETGEFIARRRVLVRSGTITYRTMFPTAS